MRHSLLVHNSGMLPDRDWESLFDVIIVGACKPAFLTDDFMSIFHVNRTTGLLFNIDDKDALTFQSLQQAGGCPDNKVFQGGYWNDLHRMLNISVGDKVLYVGDHMYADIVRSKRTLGMCVA